ncbi:MAG: ClbS/DfsB family four-helix bundle protein [Chloroflexia bacterium]|nr:ClbS/DfsB family four-helix bundle protein [Chloroflexia bacterium]
MTAEMIKETFGLTLRADHQEWESILSQIPEERMIESGAAGDWSVKDLIAHITIYERWTIEWLKPALQEQPPAWNYPEGEDTATLDERNARFYEQNRDRALDDIRTEADEVHARLVDVVEQLPDDAVSKDIRDFAPQVGAYYREGTTVWQAIDGNAAEHYREHTADVQGWLNRS